MEKWKIKVDKEFGDFGGDIISQSVSAIESPEGIICEFADDYGTNISANAQLIVTVVNACISINPENPLAVAESIGDMYGALGGLPDAHSFLPSEAEVMGKILKALAKAEGK